MKDFDVREDEDRTDDDRKAEIQRRAAAVSGALPDDERVDVVSYDRSTGNPAVVVSTGGRATTDGDFVSRALDHVQTIGPALGLAPQQPPEFVADPHVQRTSSGSAAVHLRQHYRGLAIYEATETVRFDPSGRLTEVAGRTHTVSRQISVTPRVDVLDAVKVAAFDVADVVGSDDVDPFGQSMRVSVDVSDFVATTTVADAAGVERRTVVDAPPFSSCVAHLIWFPLDDQLRLAWHVLLHLEHGPQFRVLVDAIEATVLARKQLARAIFGRASVYVEGGGLPAEDVALPIPIDRFGVTPAADLAAGEPGPWLSGTTTAGTNVVAVSNGAAPVTGQLDGNNEVIFSPPADSTDELVVNLFAYNGVMHDVFYSLGFREADGNFQADNRGRGGAGSDRVQAIVHPGPVWGTANMGTPPDGFAPLMNMGLVESTGRHTALDPDVVFHEFTHGVSNRLVGGPLNAEALDSPQSGGMGEGWGDYFACVLNRRETVGSWVVAHPRGIRAFPYDDQFPDTFEHVGSGRYTGVHEIGEIWCATLMELNRRIGTATAMQLVIDGMKLSAANPGFLAMRDAILVAARDLGAATLSAAESEQLVAGVWDAFAAYGMGPAATSIEGTLGPIEADFSTPPRPTAGTTISRSVTPALAIPDADPRGVASTLNVDAAGAITDLTVSVDIRHSYRGDLVVRLRSPEGGVSVLHARGGGSADDLIETWATAQGDLQEFIGRPIAGDWTLEVIDVARRDVGTLEEWSLEARVADVAQIVEIDAPVGLVIPDNDDTGVFTELELAGGSPLSHLVVEVDITHTYIGDLVVELRAPSGQTVRLHDRDGGSIDNLIEVYDSDQGELAQFLGHPITGAWRLSVSDHAGRDIGKLNRWAIRATL